jgi:hypothetical protein
MGRAAGLNAQKASSYTLGYADRRLAARNFPAFVDVLHFPRRDAVCVHNGPWAGITFADKSHARFRLQRSIEPRHSVRGASSYFDLNDLRHYVSPALKTHSPAKQDLCHGCR